MSRRVRIADLASDEPTAAVRWYESRRPGIGAELFDAVTATIDLTVRQPEIGAAAYPNPQVRRLRVERFPYQVVYRLDEVEIVVVALAHLKRRPGYWKHRD